VLSVDTPLIFNRQTVTVGDCFNASIC
jgi:hypothetical protein